jgi:hypothetical protein
MRFFHLLSRSGSNPPKKGSHPWSWGKLEQAGAGWSKLEQAATVNY